MKIFDIDKQNFIKIEKIEDASTKVQRLSHAIYCYKNNIFEVLYDKTQPALKSYVENLNKDTLYQDDMQFLFFTSGTTGTPTGAYKTRQNLDLEIDAILKVLPKKNVKRVVATVPFIHLYGINIGALLANRLDIELHVKENFLLQELIDEAQKEDTLVITTPLFIKALNRVQSDVKFDKTLFIVSTAPLQSDDAKEFCSKYSTNVMQIFGSTETGAIAHKLDDETICKAFDSVILSTKDNMLRVTSPFISQKVLTDEVYDLVQPFQSEDIVKILNEKEFILLGRGSNLAKIAGKRISTLQIENIIENLANIKCVMIKIRRVDNALKDEVLDIYIESNKTLKASELRKLLTKNFGTMHIPFKLHNHKKILRSSVGKKIGFEDKNKV
ncbi:MAG: AMP-binding protein [Sulfurimonas sp.]|nr:AMP-binding protein [Sulfurimonas sp.]